MAHDYNRVKKGMVFWASLSGYGANKKFNVNDKEYESCLFFGTAPWVVLSVGNGIRAPSCEKVVTIAQLFQIDLKMIIQLMSVTYFQAFLKPYYLRGWKLLTLCFFENMCVYLKMI